MGPNGQLVFVKLEINETLWKMGIDEHNVFL